MTPSDATGPLIERGRFQTVRPGDDVTLMGIGTTVSIAVDAADELARQGTSARVLNASSLAPLDEAAIVEAASTTRAIVTLEEANVAGGLGAAVASRVAQLDGPRRVPMRILGFDEFAPTGSTAFLLERAGLHPTAVAQTAQDLLDRD